MRLLDELGADGEVQIPDGSLHHTGTGPPVPHEVGKDTGRQGGGPRLVGSFYTPVRVVFVGGGGVAAVATACPAGLPGKW
ncbi:MAG: hypothetical protein ACRDRH_08160 [Pseudonocardia sp.]